MSEYIKDFINNISNIKNQVNSDVSSQIDEAIKKFLIEYNHTKRLEDVLSQLSAREEELSVVYELENVTSSVYNIDDLLINITNKVADIMHAQDCTIFLKMNGTDELYVRSTQSYKEEAIKKIKVKLGEGIVGTVVASGQPIIANDLEHEPRWKKQVSQEIDFPTKCIICAPMTFNGAIIGAIEVINKIDNNDGFLLSDLRVLTIISNQTAKAIETTRIINEAQREDKLATIGKMAYGIIHDIKNPMAIIKGYAELIQMKEPSMTSYAQKIISSIDRLVGMTQELLDYSKGELNLVFKQYNINTFIDNFIDLIKNNFESANISIIKEVNYDGDIVFDHDRILRVLFNLSTNAKDSMQNGGKFIINVTKTDENHLKFTLSDTGIGIPPEIIKSVFEPFVTHGKANGTGLGMSITKKIVEAHKGTIDLQSIVGVGTQIFFFLPINQVES